MKLNSNPSKSEIGMDKSEREPRINLLRKRATFPFCRGHELGSLPVPLVCRANQDKSGSRLTGYTLKLISFFQGYCSQLSRKSYIECFNKKEK